MFLDEQNENVDHKWVDQPAHEKHCNMEFWVSLMTGHAPAGS